MARTRCEGCGATVDVALVRGTEDRVPLEVHPDSSADVDRYKIVELNPLTVVKVTKGAEGEYYPDHRADCPAHGNGLGG